MTDVPPVTNIATRRPCPESPAKRAYADEEMALAAARSSALGSGLQVTAYRCGACGLYHLGKQPGTSRHPVFSPERPTLPEPDWETLHSLDQIAHMPVGDLIIAARLMGLRLEMRVTRNG